MKNFDVTNKKTKDNIKMAVTNNCVKMTVKDASGKIVQVDVDINQLTHMQELINDIIEPY